MNTVWTGCYREGWQGLIVSDQTTDTEQLALFNRGEDYSAFQHPAKVSRSLIKRIYQHLAAHYGLHPGAVVLDPFAGCGMHGLDALLMGYHFVGCELEPKFVTLAQKNVDYWRHKFGPQPGSVMLLRGDSRYLRQVLQEAQASCVVSSPPYGQSVHSGNGIDKSKLTGNPPGPHSQVNAQGYGDTPGQLANLLPGAICLSSPPYSGNEKSDYRVPDANGQDRDERRGKRQGKGSFRGSETYGQTEGQLGQLPSGVLLSSPPYGDRCSNDNQRTLAREGLHAGHNEGDGQTYGTTEGQLAALPMQTLISSPPYEGSVIQERGGKLEAARLIKKGLTDQVFGLQYGTNPFDGYGEAPEQLGNKTGPTFWSAAAQVLTECYYVLPPGALAVWIVKAFVRHKTIVDFPSDWLRLCQAYGFHLVERIDASLVTIHGHEPTFWGETVTRKTKKVSFFRRNYEKDYPALAINTEVVLITRRNGDPHAQ